MTMRRRMVESVALVGAVVVGLHAQDGVTPEPPRGLIVPELSGAPYVYDTAEEQKIRVVVVAGGLSRPWSCAFPSDGTILVTERTGNLRVVRDGVLDPEPVAGAPEPHVEGSNGLFDVLLHPRFGENRLVYFTYNKPQEGKDPALGIARGRWNGDAIEGLEDIFTADSPSTVSRMAFARDGTLYVGIYPGGEENPQDPMSLGGKVLRLRDDGGIPDDNPFVGRKGFRPELFSLGHRTPTGLAVHPETGVVWEVEMGPNGGDEVNVLAAGVNYGWPLVSLGRTYEGPWHAGQFMREGYEDPTIYWMPSISTSGLEFYSGDQLEKWKGDLFVGGMRFGQIPGTGQLQRIRFNENGEEIRREALLTDLRRRIRDVRQGPDGFLYLLTDSDDGYVLRIEPAE